MNFYEKVIALLQQIITLSSTGGGDATADNQELEIAQLEAINDSNAKTYGDWISIKTYNNTDPDTANTVPASGDFVSINLAEGISIIEVYPEDLVITNAPSAIVFGVWAKVGTDAPYLLGTFSAVPGENRATVLSGNAFKSLSPIFQELKQKNTTDIKVAVTTIVDATRITYAVDTNTNGNTTGNALGANTGFSSTLCATNSNSAGSPPGIAGTISDYNASTDAVTIENANFITGEVLRLPWGATPNNYFPPLGLSGKVVCATINEITNKITITGSGIDFRKIKNRTVRLRLSSISSAISSFPFADGAVLNATTTYYLLNVSGGVGNQTAQLSTNGITPLTFTSQGAGWVYVFPYRDIDNVTINSSNQLTIDGNAIDIQNDWASQSISVTTAGTAATVFLLLHGFANNDQVRIGGTTAPGGASLGDIYFVIVVDINNFKLSPVSGGLPIAFTSAGTAVTVQKVGTSIISAVTVTAGTPSVISFGASATTTTPHWMGALQNFTLGGGTRPGAAYTYTDLFIASTSLTANSFQCSQLRGAPSVAFETAGTSPTLTAMLRFGNMLIERATVLVSSVDDSTVSIADSAGSAIAISGIVTGTCTIAPVNSPVITSGSVLVRAIKE